MRKRRLFRERVAELTATYGPDACWPWPGSVMYKGYGKAWHEGVKYFAHRLSYAMYIGPIPEGLVIDHLCRNRLCVNPRHLEAVSMRENIRRGIGPSTQNRSRVACLRGHHFTPENTIREGRKRRCRQCTRARQRRWEAEKRALAEQ